MQDWFDVQSATYGCYYILVEINGYDTYRISLSYYHEDDNMVDYPTDKTTTSNKAYAKRAYKKFKEYAEDDRYGWNYHNEPTWEYTKNDVLPSVSKYYFPESRGNEMIKIKLTERDLGDFNSLGTSNRPDDKRTNYKFTDLYIPGNDAAPDELFQQVMNNYITDRGELEAIQKILERNGWDEEAKIVGYYIDEIDEEAKYGDDYNISRMKIDIADGYDKAGFEDANWGKVNWGLDCYVDGDYVVIVLTDPETWERDADRVPVDEFMAMDRDKFDSWVGQLRFYGDFEPEDGE